MPRAKQKSDVGAAIAKLTDEQFGFASNAPRSPSKTACAASAPSPKPARSTPFTRYETSLHRHLMQLMHELEAAQARRRGQNTPLLRADIQLVAAK